MSSFWFFELLETITANLVVGWRGVLDFLLEPLGTSLEPLEDVPIVGGALDWISNNVQFPTSSGGLVPLSDVSVISLIIGVMLPTLLCFIIVKWLLDLVT